MEEKIMSLKDELDDTKKYVQERKNEWQKESNQKMSPKRRKVFTWLYIILAIGILILPWLKLKNVAYFFDAILAFFLVTDGYPMAYVFGRRGMGRAASVILSLLIGLVIVVIAAVYVFIMPDIFQ